MKMISYAIWRNNPFGYKFQCIYKTNESLLFEGFGLGKLLSKVIFVRAVCSIDVLVFLKGEFQLLILIKVGVFNGTIEME
jgi:hypothetical protein